ncbi:SesB, P-loop containing Nucleoside Triphosphate Hydrolase [Metarhizium guizhouense ARSEF 977]|uniref:SesB, P-loop containing Nucleoside Triphosphate Hydrolase n=1 Tax=Metarhizium guizhouense (strain ARSEF 977) TaxID=1276136 RepID=A0A0B4GYV4_METGA|nr:SesB, P-loop containing Nucleoside Triphosphate Hydrolase [Metarhizium guizhouense ARSEF 977]
MGFLRSKRTSRSQRQPSGNSLNHEAQNAVVGYERSGGSADSRLSSINGPDQSFPDGVEVLYNCHDALVDICFVHGLTGNRNSTWTAHGQFAPWPQTLLPRDLGKARIITYGYDAYFVRKSVASQNGLSDHARNFLSDLTTDRASNDPSRPLLLVAHSLGGLICKEAILLSRNNPDEHLKNMFHCTKGIIFMGTPHRGSWMADWAGIPAKTLGVVKSANKSLLQVLKTDNTHLQSVQANFCSMIREQEKNGRNIDVTCFFEELPMFGLGKVVPKDSATLEDRNSLSIHANHIDMVKFRSADDNGYQRVLGELDRWIKNPGARQAPQSMNEGPVREHPGLSFHNSGSGDMFNAPGGTLNYWQHR